MLLYMFCSKIIILTVVVLNSFLFLIKELISEDSLLLWIKSRRDDVDNTELGTTLDTI